MSTEKEKIKQTIMELYGELARLTNLPKSMGEVYSAIYLSEKPLCMDEIIDFLKISKGTASTTIRKLEELKAIKKVWVEGDRKNYYKISGSIPLLDSMFKRDMIISDACDTLNKIMDNPMDEETKKYAEKKLHGILVIKEISKKITESLKMYDNVDYEEVYRKLHQNSSKEKK
ncbi:GbsR/MarR family transcriptional regulator [Methanococcus voltae]|uniref:HTH-type transcriptional regulator n=1 Tax=Methanococcus voltae (strain ATCC BAA-1334 / A3) TaxID=456320 RepID=D7DUX2_METV3|nr:transcriptional regulator [Methanococcus voltae]MCS3900736.1 DNA-binding transcriptional regulator GbsR (MarR family) [Methanococcus voltae]